MLRARWLAPGAVPPWAQPWLNLNVGVQGLEAERERLLARLRELGGQIQAAALRRAAGAEAG